jgi:hypothetical protein
LYTTHSPMTYIPDELGISATLQGLQNTVPGIVESVQNTLLHVFWAERYGERLTEERAEQVNIRSAADMLRMAYTLKPESLNEKRLLSERVVGNCRDFTVLSVALMRSVGIPARARCGFGAYFSTPEMKLRYIDHWVAEYWNKSMGCWVKVDAQLDGFQQDALKIDFDPYDVPHDRFITGGAAWRMCREEGADPESFGIFEMSGLGFIRGNMIRDLAALGKMPLLPWDCWGIILDDEVNDLEILDRVADVTGPGTERYDEITELCNHPRLGVPEVLVSWMGGAEPQRVRLSDVTEKIR